MKRIISFFLIFAMILILAVPAFAINIRWEDDDVVSGVWLLNLDLDLTPFRDRWYEDISFTYQGHVYNYISFAYASDSSYWIKLEDYAGKVKNLYHSAYDGWAPNNDLDTYRILIFDNSPVSLKFKNWLLANAVPLQGGSYVSSDFYLKGSYGVDDLAFVQSPEAFGLIPDMGYSYYDINLTFTDSFGLMYYGMRVREGSILLLRYDGTDEVFIEMWDDVDGLTHPRYSSLTFPYLQYVPENFYNWFSMLFTSDASGSAPTYCDRTTCKSVDANFDDICDRCLLPLADSVLCTCTAGYISDLDTNGRCDNCTLRISVSVVPPAPDGWASGYPAPPLGSSVDYTKVSTQYFIIDDNGTVKLFVLIPIYDATPDYAWVHRNSDDCEMRIYDLDMGASDAPFIHNVYVYDLVESAWSLTDSYTDHIVIFGKKGSITEIYGTGDLPPTGEYEDFGDWLASIWQAIINLPGKILDGIKSIFVPDLDTMKNSWNDFMVKISPNTYAFDENGLGTYPLYSGEASTMGGLIDLEGTEPSDIQFQYKVGDVDFGTLTALDTTWLVKGRDLCSWMVNVFLIWMLTMFWYREFMTFLGQASTIAPGIAKVNQYGWDFNFSFGRGSSETSLQPIDNRGGLRR